MHALIRVQATCNHHSRSRVRLRANIGEVHCLFNECCASVDTTVIHRCKTLIVCRKSNITVICLEGLQSISFLIRVRISYNSEAPEPVTAAGFETTTRVNGPIGQQRAARFEIGLPDFILGPNRCTSPQPVVCSDLFIGDQIIAEIK